MVERIRDDSILIGEQWLKDSTISVKASSIENSVFSLEVVRDRSFKFLMTILCSTNETNR